MRALHLAASHNEAEIVSMLIDAGADLRCFDEENGTPLHFACMEGNVKIVMKLFEAAEGQGWVVVQEVSEIYVFISSYTCYADRVLGSCWFSGYRGDMVAQRYNAGLAIKRTLVRIPLWYRFEVWAFAF